MKGFTLIEVVILILLLGITGVIFTSVLTEGNVAYLFLSRQTLAVQNARVAMNWMTQELTSELLVGGYHSFHTTNRPNIDYLRFTRNSDGLGVIYSYAGETLTRQLGADSARILATNVTAFTFTYLNASDTPITTPVSVGNLPNIVSIRMNMTIQIDERTVTLQSEITPRNREIPDTVGGAV